jgi:hypothetical protein
MPWGHIMSRNFFYPTILVVTLVSIILHRTNADWSNDENVSAQLTVISDKYDAKQFRLSLEIHFEEFKLNEKKH